MKHQLPEKQIWTPRLMKDALVHAIRTMRALPGGGWTSNAGWVDFNDSWGYVDDEDRERREDRFRPSAKDISHMEVLLIGKGGRRALLNGAVLGYRDQRKVLIRWALWVAHGCRDPDGEHETEWDFSVRIRLSESEMKRLRDFAAGIMADQANDMELGVWASEKPVRRRKARGNLHIAGN